MTNLTDLTSEELRARHKALWEKLTEIAVKKLSAVAEETEALDQLMRVECELRVRRAIVTEPNPDQQDYDDFIREHSLGGQPFRER